MPTRLQMPVAERLAELRDVDVDAVEGARGRAFIPEHVDQAVRGDDLACVQEKDCEQRPLLARAYLERLPALGHLERAEDAELHRVVTTGQAASIPARLKRCASGIQALLKRNGTFSGLVANGTGGGMGITGGLRWIVVLALLLASVSAASSHGADTNPPPNTNSDRPSTVVVSVREGGFHWTDAGVGAAAALATTLLALGLVLALRPEHGGNGKP